MGKRKEPNEAVAEGLLASWRKYWKTEDQRLKDESKAGWKIVIALVLVSAVVVTSCQFAFSYYFNTWPFSG